MAWKTFDKPVGVKVNETYELHAVRAVLRPSGGVVAEVQLWNGAAALTDEVELTKASACRRFVRRAGETAPGVGQKAGAALQQLLLGLRPLLEAAAATGPQAPPAPGLEMLDETPAVLARPLDLVDGVAYAAVWPPVRETRRFRRGKDGELEALPEPETTTAPRLHVVRGDGAVFGDAVAVSLAEAGVEIRLGEPPRTERLWRPAAFRRYAAGGRPAPADVFARVAAVYDHYLDFGRSLAGQDEMCEVSACFSLATWLVAAFDVLGYPWPNGDRGAGKTKWLTVWALTSYLGELLSAAGTFAALRDLARYGAALAFDDAEGMADPKKADPDKRALLLAGNRRGVEIPLKEQVGDRWVIRWVPAFCPRAFSAIALPDPVLASRIAKLPLVRTNDAARANRDPIATDRWPCDHRALQDDLWALALHLLPEAARVWDELDAETEAVGRELEPWRAVLAVARLLERHGVEGLEARMRAVMTQHRDEKAEAIEGDWSAEVIRALLEHLADRDIRDVKDVRDISKEGVELPASEIRKLVVARRDQDEDDDERRTPSAWQIGRVLARLRFKQQPGRSKGRKWAIPTADVFALARSYGLLAEAADEDVTADEDVASHDATDPLRPNVPNGPNGPNVPSDEETPPADVLGIGRLVYVLAEDGSWLVDRPVRIEDREQNEAGVYWYAVEGVEGWLPPERLDPVEHDDEEGPP